MVDCYNGPHMSETPEFVPTVVPGHDYNKVITFTAITFMGAIIGGVVARNYLQKKQELNPENGSDYDEPPAKNLSLIHI